MKIADVMTPDLETVSPSDTLKTAARLMADLDSGALPVGEEIGPEVRVPLGHDHGVVAEDLLENIEIAARHHKQASSCMAQIMEVKAQDAGALTSILKSGTNVNEVTASSVTEDQVRIAVTWIGPK